ncbi:MAG TPA: large conductance mechanosensitive channel protein MscL [Clostridia bacterium]|nr:large conductance mechanosensitive channel protein MscL [Clostridia bacterium]
MWKDFKEFATKGNVLDLSIGVIIGGAFGKIVTSVVNDIIMPLISILTGPMDFSDRFINLSGDGTNYSTLAEAVENGAVTLNYGSFLTVLLDFFVISFCIFIVIRQISKFKVEPEPAPPTTKPCSYCMSEIDLAAIRCPHCTSKLDDEN